MVLPILSVKDMTASLDFYIRQLGWSKLFGLPGSGGSDMFSMVSPHAGVSYGLSASDSPDPRGQGVVLMTYVADDVDIDGYYAECQSRGTVITTEIKDEYWGDRCFQVSDPDGYSIMFCKTIKNVTAEEVIASMAQSS